MLIVDLRWTLMLIYVLAVDGIIQNNSGHIFDFIDRSTAFSNVTNAAILF